MIKQGRHNIGYLIDISDDKSFNINKSFWNKKQAVKYWKGLILKVNNSGEISTNIKYPPMSKTFCTFHKITRKKGVNYRILLEEI